MGAGASTRPTSQQPDGLYQHNRPRMGAGARSAGRALRVQQQPHPSQGPRCRALCCCALCCCCVTPHTRPTSLPASDRCVAALQARHPSQCPPLRPCVAVGLRALWALLLAYNVGRLKARLRAGITARPKGLSGIPAPLGGPSCGGGPGSAGACARHAAPHIGPSRAGAGPLVGTPGPHPVKQCRTQGTASHPRRRFYQNGGRWAAVRSTKGAGEVKQQGQGERNRAAPLPRGTRGNARPRGGECHTGERHARPRQAAYGGPCVAISGAAETETRVRGPCGRTPTAHHPPKERKPP